MHLEAKILVCQRNSHGSSHYENIPEAQTGSSPNSLLAGLGIGLLVSTALSVSASLDDLVTAGVEVLRIAFRLGVHVRDVSLNLEAPDGESSDSWAWCVYGLTADKAQTELDSIHEREVSDEMCASPPGR